MTLKCSAEPKRRYVAQIAAFEAEPVPLWRNTPRGKKAVCGIVQRRDTLKSLYLAAAFLYALRGASHGITSSKGGAALVFFQYGEREIAYLAGRDKRLGQAIEKIGHIDREVDSDIFSAIVHHILGQQISTAAQATVWNRLLYTVGSVSADSLTALGRERLQQVGTTYKKADYILDLAEQVRRGTLDPEQLWSLSDEDVIRELTKLKGVGVWTAEMILIFCMQRPNVLSFGDLAILRGMRMLYRHRQIDRVRFERYRKRYAPYGTVASLYLWAIAGGAIPELTDPYVGK